MRNKKLSSIALVLVFSVSVMAQNQGVKLTGNVYDMETNAPLPGVNILIRETQSAASTNSAGFFNLKIEKTPALLYFSYVGYESKQYMVQSSDTLPLKVYLKAAIRKIGEVTISGARISKVVQGDTLNILDYEIADDQIIMVANPYKMQKDQRLYLTSLYGEIMASKTVRDAGHLVEVPESISIKTKLLLFKDCFKNIQLLTRNSIYQIFVNQNDLQLLYPTTFEQFITLLYPAKAVLDGRLFYQKASITTNETYFIEEKDKKYKLIKTVYDKYGAYRYTKPIHFLCDRPLSDPSRVILKDSWERCVSAPVIQRTNDIAIFDFFSNNIEFFNSDGMSVRSVPISFHLKDYNELLVVRMRDIDQDNFTQKILYDEKTNRAWSLWTPLFNGHYILKEINLDTGVIDKIVEIPDYPFIEKIQVHNNRIYFLYTEKSYPYNHSLYQMVI